MDKKNKRVLLGATHSVIEPLGLLHLASIAKEEGFTPKIAMARDGFEDFDRRLKEFNPGFLGFSVYTGNHLDVFRYLDRIKHDRPDMDIILGGPHPTYFPKESLDHSDYAVMSEGFNSFRRILRGEAEKGIVYLSKREEFPDSERADFYSDNQEYNKSPIKSIIASTGCPYSCTYCYNSSTIDSIGDIGGLENIIGESGKEEMHLALGGTRLFPMSLRPVDDIIMEAGRIMGASPDTKMIYFQDDVFGANMPWLRDFSRKYRSIINIPFHAQMRFEAANSYSAACRERLHLLREAGCTGLTLAIESADPLIRSEVLNRRMPESLMYESLNLLSGLGYKVRTEQMLGLPCGATSKQTPVNLEADLATLALNVRLKEETGLPTMAWASIFAPYRGTMIGEYCRKHGFYSGGNNDVPETFFQRSVLRFPKRWVGPELVAGMCDEWLNEEDQDKYRDNMLILRDLFNYFAMMPKGDKLAETFINSSDHSYAGLSKSTRHHLYNSVLYGVD